MSPPGRAAGALSRRQFVALGAGAGALVLGIGTRGQLFAAGQAASPLAPNQWLRIDTTGVVTIVAARSEMGQGVRTALPMIVADELGADWQRVTVEHAQPGPAFPQMRTSGSGSVAGSWGPLRRAAAAARQLLVAAAAERWEADPADCTATGGRVLHARTGRSLPFGELVARAAQLPVPQDPALKPPSALTLIGTRVPRVDGPAIVDGTATYGLDVRRPGMRFAAIARSAQAGGTPGAVNDAAARAVPGVREVVLIPTGVAVVADRTWAALRGRDALAVEWDLSRASRGSSAEYEAALEAALGRGKVSRREGEEVSHALAAADRRMAATYYWPFQSHASMEPLNCVAEVLPGRCELWVGTQAPNQVQQQVATLLGLREDQVTVHVALMGGGFGRRLDVDHVLEAVEVARRVTGPVQVVWSREDDMRHGMYQPGQVNRLSAALGPDDLPVAWRHEVADYNLTMFGEYDPGYNPSADGDPWGGHDTPYAFRGLDVTLALLPAPVPTGAWRSVSYPPAVMARECFLDEIAHAVGQDPLALRLALLPSPGNVTRGTRVLPNGDRLRRVLQLAADRSGWGTPPPARADGRRWGRGIACNGYHQQTMVAEVAEVSVGDAGDIRVHRVVCAADCGQVINLSGLEGQFESGVLWGLAATLHGGMTFANGAAREGNYHQFRVPRFPDAPVVELHTVASDLPPLGAGEQPVPPVAAAVLNAVYAATGVRVQRVPVDQAALAR